MNVHPIEWQDGALDIRRLVELSGIGGCILEAGTATFPAGMRHPQTGLGAHETTEVSLILDGTFDVETADAITRISGNSLVVIPAGEGHAATALCDSRVFYVLFGPKPE